MELVVKCAGNYLEPLTVILMDNEKNDRSTHVLQKTKVSHAANML